MMIALFFMVILAIPMHFVYCLTHGIPFRYTHWDGSIISSESQPLSMPYQASKSSKRRKSYKVIIKLRFNLSCDFLPSLMWLNVTRPAKHI